MRGYGWIFPCLIDGVPHANVGVYALPPVDAAVHASGAARGCSPASAAGDAAPPGFPIHTYAPTLASRGADALLVGDAAGVDPLMGEGISFALEYGRAGRATRRRRPRRRVAWTSRATQRAVHDGPIGRKLARLVWARGLFYGRHWRVWFRARAQQRRARQALGLRGTTALTPGTGARAAGALARRRLVRVAESGGGRKKAAADRIERLLWQLGIRCVAGVDEVGMGPLAGPVVAAAVVLPPDVHPGLADSKQLTARQRERLDGRDPRVRARRSASASSTSDEIDR